MVKCTPDHEHVVSIKLDNNVCKKIENFNDNVFNYADDDNDHM